MQRDVTVPMIEEGNCLFLNTAFILTRCTALILERKFKQATAFSVEDIRQCQLWLGLEK